MQADRHTSSAPAHGWSNGAPAAAPLGRPALERCLRHLIWRDLKESDPETAERPAARALVMPSPDPVAAEDLRLGAEGLGLDSLALISAATAVSRFFDMGKSGFDDYLLFEDTLAGWVGLVERHLAEQGAEAELVFQTSGSTDTPKLIRKRLADLSAEVGALIADVIPPSARRVVALPPPQHIFGFLFTVLLPDRRGLPVVDAVFRGAGSILQGLTAGDVVIGTPFNWNTLLSAGHGFPAGIHGVTSAGAMPPDQWRDLARAGLTDLREIFGSTETGGIGWRQGLDDPFTLLPHLVREADAIRPIGGGAPLPLQDHLEWGGAGHFLPAGRVDRAVKIAGVNVSLTRVRETLCASDLVADAAVRPSENRLKAFVVPSDPATPHKALEAELDAHCRRSLADVARPVRYTFGPALPRDGMGKLSDW